MNLDRIKPSFCEDRQELGKILPLPTPFNVILDISEACNFKCGYCFRSSENKQIWGYAREPRLMEWELFCQCVDQIKEFPDMVKQISLSNHGEPLCNRKLPDMARYIKKQGISSRVSIHTNGSLLDEAYAEDLADSGIDKVVVSIQGLSSESYEKTCGAKVDFSLLLKRLKLFYQKKTQTQLCIKIADAALKEEEHQVFYEIFSEIADRVYIEKVVDIWKGMESCDRPYQNKFGLEFPEQRCCPLIFHTITVDPAGFVYPCTQLLTPYILGHVREKSLKECWNSKERETLLKKQLTLSAPPVCDGCNIGNNSIFTKEDMIDEFREEILARF